MKAQKRTERVWIVVKVSRGLPSLAEAYRDKKSAYAREQALRVNINIEYDETDVFETRIR
jgi:hypothetical protein